MITSGVMGPVEKTDDGIPLYSWRVNGTIRSNYEVKQIKLQRSRPFFPAIFPTDLMENQKRRLSSLKQTPSESLLRLLCHDCYEDGRIRRGGEVLLSSDRTPVVKGGQRYTGGMHSRTCASTSVCVSERWFYALSVSKAIYEV